MSNDLLKSGNTNILTPRRKELRTTGPGESPENSKGLKEESTRTTLKFGIGEMRSLERLKKTVVDLFRETNFPEYTNLI